MMFSPLTGTPPTIGVRIELSFLQLEQLAVELNKYIPLNINGGIAEPLYSFIRNLEKYHPDLPPYDYSFKMKD